MLQASRTPRNANALTYRIVAISLVCAASMFEAAGQDAETGGTSKSLRVMTWNIWHGGRETGDVDGPRRVIETIRASDVDVVAMQETYGSGERIARGLGFHLHARGKNLSIHSRYPIVEDISVFEAFKCVGAIIELPGKTQLAVYSIWLPYGEDIWLPEVRRSSTTTQLLKACKPSADAIQQILQQIDERLADPKYRGIPVIIAGDFNSMSHLDWKKDSVNQYGRVVAWETSRLMQDAGFTDSFRQANATVNRLNDATWSPRFKDQEQDRIDFIYYRHPKLEVAGSIRIDQHNEAFPSDHAAVMTTFSIPD